jgi:flagellar protein FlgJ
MGLDPHLLAGQANSRDPRAIDAVANGFESVFLSILLKEMRQTLEPGGMFPEDKSDVLGGMFDMYLGQHLAQAGGFGIADLIKKQLKASTGQPNNATAASPAAGRSLSGGVVS